MKQYLLSIYQPDGAPPAAEVLEKIADDVQAVQAEMQRGWRMGVLGRAASAGSRPCYPRSGAAPMTDGPYVEGKEHIGGLVIIKAENLDDALDWGRKVARATTLPVEVRPFHDQLED